MIIRGRFIGDAPYFTIEIRDNMSDLYVVESAWGGEGAGEN